MDVNVMSEAPRAAIKRLAGALPVTLLLSLRRLCTERIIGVGDVVVEAIARGLTNPLLPLSARSRIGRPLAEGPLRPRTRSIYLVLGELITDLGVLSRELGERVL